MVDWTKIPDLGTVALLATAFATVARRSQTPVSSLWLSGWVLIAIHFAALLFADLSGSLGAIAEFVALATLAWAGLLFLWAAVPYRKEPSSIRMMSVVLCTNSLFIITVIFGPGPLWLLQLSAFLLGAAPLAVAISTARSFMHPLRYVIVAMYVGLSIFLLANQKNPDPYFGLNAVFFTIYFGCSLHFFFVFRRLGTAAIVTTAGFLAWASVFAIAPSIHSYLPSIQFESEVWNLPKYIVAVGMILIVLQQQIEHNKHLALHDELTGLPNRRLFHDRLTSALERAKRSGTRTGLLLVDLDRFKQVNDSVGHHGGDEVLKHVAQVLQGRIRRCDTVARTGGDEFSIILEEPITRSDAERVCHSLIELVHQSLAFEGHTIRVGASIGLAIYPEDAPNSETLRVAADLRMYAHKNKTRGSTEVTAPLTPQSQPASDAVIESRNTA
jgi:diguanylate cyclase (GGDEF)-like protein